MLAAGADHDSLLPQNELVYIAFRLCFFDVATDIDVTKGTEDEDEQFGFLHNQVPFFRDVPPIVQLDLLASLWAKHRHPNIQEIYLAEAAVLYAICHDAGRIAVEWLELDLSGPLDGGPVTVTCRATDQIREELDELFDHFWDDEDFLMVGDSPDREPFSERLGTFVLGIPKEWIDEMFAVLGRAKPGPEMLRNLRGLLTDKEIETYRSILGFEDTPPEPHE
jgi:hypothetical protein